MTVQVLSMKALPLLLLALFVVRSEAGVCKGEDPCKACKDCSACKYCAPKNPKGGSCGTLRAQNAAEVKKRLVKRR